jgi:hypothetical protein
MSTGLQDSRSQRVHFLRFSFRPPSHLSVFPISKEFISNQ